MSEPRQIRFTLEVDLDTDPISGVLQGSAFTGWMGLAREIEVAIEAARATPQPTTPLADGGS
jgi:hypothetical protein